MDQGNLIFLQKMENQQENEMKNSSSQLINLTKKRTDGKSKFVNFNAIFLTLLDKSKVG